LIACRQLANGMQTGRGMVTTGAATPRAGSVGCWRRHAVASVLLRSAIVAVPLVVSSIAGLMVGLSIGGVGLGSILLRLVLAGVTSLFAFVAIERLARRFLPLAMLLKLSLLFPDQAPSRFSVALRSSSVRKLQAWARTAHEANGLCELTEKVVTLATALNTHDRRTRGHSERTRAMADLIGAELRLPEDEMHAVRWGAFLHDVGKIFVPAEILNKPGAPTAREWETLKRHPGDGGVLVEPLRPFLGSGVEAVSGHHENFDGSGYPQGLSGAQIALTARIVSVADSFEVMTAVRSYKRPMKAADARRELASHSGTQFDPTVVRALLNVSLGRLHWTLGIAAWLAELPFITVIPRAFAQIGAVAAGPTVSLSALTGAAALSLGAVVVPASVAPAPFDILAASTHVAAPTTTTSCTTSTTTTTTSSSSASSSSRSGLAGHAAVAGRPAAVGGSRRAPSGPGTSPVSLRGRRGPPASAVPASASHGEAATVTRPSSDSAGATASPAATSASHGEAATVTRPSSDSSGAAASAAPASASPGEGATVTRPSSDSSGAAASPAATSASHGEAATG